MMYRSRRWFLLPASLAAAALLMVGCGGGKGADGAGKATSQVALRVNGQEVSIHQLDVLMHDRAATLPGQAASAVARQVLADLSDQELAAQAARKAGLENDPRVLQKLEAARREVLAGSYQQQLGEKAVEPTADEVDAYYDKNPALFAQRRSYILRETYVNVSADRIDAVKARLQATTSAAQATEYIRDQSFATTTRNLSLSAEDLPFAVMQPLAGLNPGQSLVLPRDGGLRLLTVLDAQLTPLERHAARRSIAAFLLNERKQKLVADGMKTLRDTGKVEYLGAAAAWAPAASK